MFLETVSEMQKGSKCELGCFIANAHLFHVDLWCSNDEYVIILILRHMIIR
jgi:hypothetical protein